MKRASEHPHSPAKRTKHLSRAVEEYWDAMKTVEATRAAVVAEADLLTGALLPHAAFRKLPDALRAGKDPTRALAQALVALRGEPDIVLQVADEASLPAARYAALVLTGRVLLSRQVRRFQLPERFESALPRCDDVERREGRVDMWFGRGRRPAAACLLLTLRESPCSEFAFVRLLRTVGEDDEAWRAASAAALAHSHRVPESRVVRLIVAPALSAQTCRDLGRLGLLPPAAAVAGVRAMRFSVEAVAFLLQRRCDGADALAVLEALPSSPLLLLRPPETSPTPLYLSLRILEMLAPADVGAFRATCAAWAAARSGGEQRREAALREAVGTRVDQLLAGPGPGAGPLREAAARALVRADLPLRSYPAPAPGRELDLDLDRLFALTAEGRPPRLVAETREALLAAVDELLAAVDRVARDVSVKRVLRRIAALRRDIAQWLTSPALDCCFRSWGEFAGDACLREAVAQAALLGVRRFAGSCGELALERTVVARVVLGHSSVYGQLRRARRVLAGTAAGPAPPVERPRPVSLPQQGPLQPLVGGGGGLGVAGDVAVCVRLLLAAMSAPAYVTTELDDLRASLEANPQSPLVLGPASDPALQSVVRALGLRSRVVDVEWRSGPPAGFWTGAGESLLGAVVERRGGGAAFLVG